MGVGNGVRRAQGGKGDCERDEQDIFVLGWTRSFIYIPGD